MDAPPPMHIAASRVFNRVVVMGLILPLKSKSG